MGNSTLRQRGVFTIELALVTLIIFSFITFTCELTERQCIHGLLQNLSFSGASLIKERTQLYDSSPQITHKQADELYQLLSRSMSRSFAGFQESAFGMTLEQVTFLQKDIKNPVLTLYKKGKSCPKSQKHLVHEVSLFFLTERGNPAPLYRVSLCYIKSDNTFLSNLMSAHRLSSNAIMVGR
ncbi:tight adherence pilus pseudopilin TadF [Sansalvadorimonas verongulae]|uniref:tight adherence pilus pseudopilin TadF n=1 Tax=Sansalvadorimonas verongulae TaxID=2172824 RepID=UPI0018AD1843|nr:tight adherence pilus pseudopilin TadF [Sansalvadorimonas verongulae]